MPEKFGNSEMPPEEPKSPESKEELSQWQKDILESGGFESIKDLEEAISEIDLNLEGLEEGSEEYSSWLENKSTLEQMLADVKADHEPTPEEIESDIANLLERLKGYSEVFDKLGEEMQTRWYEVEMGAEVAKDRKGARAKLEIFLDELKKETEKPKE
jgi:hypothetical protein